MRQLIYQPCSNETAIKNHEKTILNSLKLSDYIEELSLTEIKTLSEIYPNDQIWVWGVQPNKSSKAWEKLKSGDIVIFNIKGTFKTSAVITMTVHNQALAKKIWGSDPNSNETWEYLFFLRDIKERNLPFESVASYTNNRSRQGFLVYSQEASNKAIKHFFYDHLDAPPKKRNPNWTREELILALKLYYMTPSSVGDAEHPEVQKLSELLNNLPLHIDKGLYSSSFRNPNGVALKLANFRAIDPNHSSKGMSSVGKLDQEIFQEFIGRKEALYNQAKQIEKFGIALVTGTALQVDIDDSSSNEGAVLTRVHRIRERDPNLVKRKKHQVIRQTGKLVCECCGFDFAQVYGKELGEGFAECHHKKPVSEMKQDEETSLVDLAIVCSNCHRMIHRYRPWKSVSEIKNIIESQPNVRD